jgi:transcriptional regulator with XRE-family HTH domain
MVTAAGAATAAYPVDRGLRLSQRTQVQVSPDEPPNALQELVRERLERQGWSYGEVARRGGIPRSTVHHLATTDRLVRMPQPTTLEGLARGLELPLDAVRRAAARTCGIHVYEATPDPEVDLLMASLRQLSAQDRRHVTALVESLLKRDREDGDDGGEDGSAGAGEATSGN